MAYKKNAANTFSREIEGLVIQEMPMQGTSRRTNDLTNTMVTNAGKDTCVK